MTIVCHDLWDDPNLPDLDAIERLVVMGGPMGADDDELHPFLARERELLARVVERGTPVLGVCLGAQLLASALGGRVYRGHGPEIGAGSVKLTAAAEADPLLGTVPGAELPVFHWHGDTFDLPDGATLLASSAAYPHQAFRHANAWGFQFHVELRAADAENVSTHLDGDRSVEADELASIEPYGVAILDAFLSYRG